MKHLRKVFLAFSLLILIALCMLWPNVVLASINGFQHVLAGLREWLVSCIPLLFYVVVGIITWRYLWKIPSDAQQVEADKQQSASLTLAGFCFTSLSLLMSFFKDAIQKKEAGPEHIIVFFCCALACFVSSYMALRYRTRNAFGFMSDAFIDNGLWCVMVGLWQFFRNTTGMNRPVIVVTLSLMFYVGYLILNFFYHVRYVRKVASQ